MLPKFCHRNNVQWSMERMLLCGIFLSCMIAVLLADRQLAPLTACQHLRQAETRRSRALSLEHRSEGNPRRTSNVRIPKCTPNGEFEPLQCSNEIGSTDCWCVDEYGQEIAGTRRDTNDTDNVDLQCPPAMLQSANHDDDTAANDSNATAPAQAVTECPASSCRMYCPAGFARDARTGCPKCQCRDPCEGIECPGGQSCQLHEVRCSTEPCPPVPTCKKARSLSDLCPAGQPLTIADTPRPFLCGHEAGKPQCPPVYRCLVQAGNDYGVCCPAAIAIQKPGQCPRGGVEARCGGGGATCGSDLECPAAEKCCDAAPECGSAARTCRQPVNASACQQARLVAELLTIGEREGRGYVPDCVADGAGSGGFSRRQCSRNGLVCWCVDQRTGHKLPDTMGAALQVDCERLPSTASNRKDYSIEHSGRSEQSRSIDASATASQSTQMRCDLNICASVCEYGFKIDHTGCPTCECAEPCEGFRCAIGSHCEVARDEQCASGSALCASEPVCQPDLVYTNPCDAGVPLADNATGEVRYCRLEEHQSRDFQTQSFWSNTAWDVNSPRELGQITDCPTDYICTKLPRQSESVCCPQLPAETEPPVDEPRPQSMCEYLRDFSDRMEGTEAGMALALPTPTCTDDGHFEPRLCRRRTVHVTRAQRTCMLEEQNVRDMRALLQQKPARSPRSPRSAAGERLRLYKVNDAAGQQGEAEPQIDMPALIRYLRQHGHDANAEATYMAEILSRKLLSHAQQQQQQQQRQQALLMVQERSAKVIDLPATSSTSAQQLDRGSGKVTRAKPVVPVSSTATTTAASSAPAAASTISADLVPVEIMDCHCVDNFGTEIPHSRGPNATHSACVALRRTLDCLDITCRMGCDYGFVLDPETRCPTCECRDPCDSVECADGQECRSVEVSCEGEYCPPVPACLPRKPGQCPFLVPPGTEGSSSASCEYECRSDQHCAGARRCCSNGCGTQCVEPQLKTACQHLQTIQLHQATELGVPAKQKYIAQCNATTGAWLRVQCGPAKLSTSSICWCVDNNGQEVSGTRRNMAAGSEMFANGHNISASSMECEETAVQSRRNDACGEERCAQACEFGYTLDADGCRTCACRDPCAGIVCPGGERCQLMHVECTDEPCPQMAVCVPNTGDSGSVCAEGRPFRRGGSELVCGPQGDAEACPSTHTCQLAVASRRGVCCAKTRDVCFESVDKSCTTNANTSTSTGAMMWRFSPKSNRCVQMLADGTCPSKNLFHSEAACSSVCPVLSACERLRLRNSLAGKRLQQSSAWFQPRCDPETGLWAPVQCLGKSEPPTSQQRGAGTDTNRNRSGTSRAFSVPPSLVDSDAVSAGSAATPSVAAAASDHSAVGVCWCADKKGAPLHGSLTRGIEPLCNHRQARRRTMLSGETTDGDATTAILNDPMIEQLIGQMTLIADGDNLIESAFNETEDDDDDDAETVAAIATAASATERIIAAIATTEHHDALAQPTLRPIEPLRVRHTRCQAMQASGEVAGFPVRCAPNGAFAALQCTSTAVCWCVDAIGNQLPQSGTFSRGSRHCPAPAAIDAVTVELVAAVPLSSGIIGGGVVPHLYDIVRAELRELFGQQLPDNLRVHEQTDGRTISVGFELTNRQDDDADADDERTTGSRTATIDATDVAFALEEMVRDGKLRLANGRLLPDVTLSRFTHRTFATTAAAAAAAAVRGDIAGTGAAASAAPMAATALRPENAFQMIVFVLATTSAFLVGVFVVFVMLKRGRDTKKAMMIMMMGGTDGMARTAPADVATAAASKAKSASPKASGRSVFGGMMGDKYVDYSSPIFVLSASEKRTTPNVEEKR